MPTVLTKQDSGVQMAHPGRAPVVLGSTLNNKLIFEKRVPLDRLVTGNGTMSIRGFLSHLRNAAKLSEVGPMQKRTYDKGGFETGAQGAHHGRYQGR
jgi:hypothetical protein